MYQLSKEAILCFHYPVLNQSFSTLYDVNVIIIYYANMRSIYCHESVNNILIEVIKYFSNKNKTDRPSYIEDFIASSVSILETATTDTEQFDALEGITYRLFCTPNFN
jgi:hypothetical protein